MVDETVPADVAELNEADEVDVAVEVEVEVEAELVDGACCLVSEIGMRTLTLGGGILYKVTRFGSDAPGARTCTRGGAMGCGGAMG